MSTFQKLRKEARETRKNLSSVFTTGKIPDRLREIPGQVASTPT